MDKKNSPKFTVARCVSKTHPLANRDGAMLQSLTEPPESVKHRTTMSRAYNTPSSSSAGRVYPITANHFGIVQFYTARGRTSHNYFLSTTL